ncbi:uncharacterized protein LOC111692455, partial [Anoplophora glabripennis]|uniref:uncharacterized protein LOC111692455 n=1 Tax=Anoplophora glabripennis TaxID=217634 RepID=UPI000C77695D
MSQEILNNLTVRLDKVEPLLGEFDELQMQIEWLEKGNDYEVEREQFESEYFGLVGQIRALIQTNNVNNNENVSVHSGQSLASSNESPKVKLPPVKLPTFDGKPENWLEFKELFSEMVNEDKGLSDVQKFYYLKTSLAESVQKRLRSKEISSKNYAEVWKCLEERYENK